MAEAILIKLEERIDIQSERIQNLSAGLQVLMEGLEMTSSRVLAAQDMLLFISAYLSAESPNTARRVEAALAGYLKNTAANREDLIAEPYRRIYRELGESVSVVLRSTPERLRESFRVVDGRNRTGGTAEGDA